MAMHGHFCEPNLRARAKQLHLPQAFSPPWTMQGQVVVQGLNFVGLVAVVVSVPIRLSINYCSFQLIFFKMGNQMAWDSAAVVSRPVKNGEPETAKPSLALSSELASADFALRFV